MNKWLLTAGVLGMTSQAFAADTTAPVVSASTAPGAYTSAQKFTLSVKDDTDTTARIYYTRDGSIPTTSSTYYKAGQSFTVVDQGKVRDLWLRTLSVDKYNNSRLQSFVYYITSAPVVKPSVAAGSYVGDQRIALTAKDDVDAAPVIYYTTNGTLPSKSSTKYVAGTKIIAAGTSTTSYKTTRIRTLAMDAQGNWQRQVFDYKVKKSGTITDTAAPTVTVAPAAGTYTSAQTVAFTVKDNVDTAPKLYYTLDGSAASTSSTLYTGPITVSKSTNINTYAVDAAGNKVSSTYSYIIDNGTGIGDGYLVDEFGATGISIYFNPGTWTAAKVHYFDVLPAGAYANTTWPGASMTSVGNNWYMQSFPAATSVSMVFNNGAGAQYPTVGGKLTRTESGCFDMATKAWTTLDTCTAPITATPAASVVSGSFSSDELEVNLSLVGAPASATGLLTLDGVAPTVSHGLSFKNGQKLKLGKNTAVGQTITLWLSYNGQETKYTYTKKEAAADMVVKIQTPNWSSANAHYFNVTPSTITNSVWPGATMTAEGNGWFSYTLKGAEKASFVFNTNSGGTKALDLVGVSASGCYTVTAGAIPTETACPVPTPSVSATPGTAGSTVTFTEATGVDVTLAAGGVDDVTSGCYTTDGTDPVSCANKFTNGQKITIGKGSTVGYSATLRLYAKSAKYSTTKSASYTFKHTDIIKANAFSWDNATVYFVLTDRFRNGDTSNDHSYGRECPKSAYDKATGKVNTSACYTGYEKRTGNFRGGDLKGMLEKLNDGYFNDLGVNAIWLSVPLEQIHGFVGGKNFKHYPYHGYYILDFTKIDANLGDEALMKQVIDTAHAKGIRVIFDVVMNHVGYDTMSDADEYGFAGLKSNWESYYYTNNASSIHYETYANYLNYGDSNWSKWWGSEWVRSKAYSTCSGGTEETRCLDDLPDLKLESTAEVGLPPVLVAKWTREGRLATETAELDAFFQKSGLKRTVANYTIKWLTDWVREYGVDGFRCDTAKHVPLNIWAELKRQSNIALKEWQAKPGVIKPDDQDLPFWMTAEVWGHGVGRSAYFDNGFDNIINFDFQKSGVNIAGADSVFSSYDKAVNSDPTFNVLNYISSHDTALYNRGNLVNAGTMLLLTPGVAQIFYGDETARPVDTGFIEWNEHHRSMMNWCDGSLGSDLSPCVDKTVLSHWQKIGQFRNNHRAIGAGKHTKISDAPYTFSRVLDNDKVVVAFASGAQSISVGSIFADGTKVKDAYSGNTATVSGGKVSLTAGGVVLLEAAAN